MHIRRGASPEVPMPLDRIARSVPGWRLHSSAGAARFRAWIADPRLPPCRQRYRVEIDRLNNGRINPRVLYFLCAILGCASAKMDTRDSGNVWFAS